MATANGNKVLKKLRATMRDTKEMKDGRRAKMYIGTLQESGIKVCVVMRQSQQIFRGGYGTLTEANQNGVLCWMMDTNLIPVLRDLDGVKALMTLERETGDLWIAPLAAWEDPDKLFRLTDPALQVKSYRGSQLTYLPIQHMIHKPYEGSLLVRSR